MSKPKSIDTTVRRFGTMLRCARQMCKMTTDDAAILLRIMQDELAAYEHGTREIPLDILEHVFIMGYKMIQVRTIEHRYHNQRKMYRKLTQPNTGI